MSISKLSTKLSGVRDQEAEIKNSKKKHVKIFSVLENLPVT